MAISTSACRHVAGEKQKELDHIRCLSLKPKLYLRTLKPNYVHNRDLTQHRRRQRKGNRQYLNEFAFSQTLWRLFQLA